MGTYSIYPRQFNNSNYKLQSDTCFVVMPFSENLDNTYMVIESVASSMKIKCTRADQISTSSEPILSKICTQISQAYFIIVDITDLNPNVFYELGIAHVLRDANKVLIIKDEETICPSDIRHLHYYAYSRLNLKGLKETIEKFFAENNILEDLQSVLSFLDLLPQDSALARKFVVSLSNCIGNDIDSLIIILNNKATKSLQNQAVNLLNVLTTVLNSMNQSDDMYSLFAELILLVISKTCDVCDISDFTAKVFNGTFRKVSDEWIADCSIAILDNSLYFYSTVSWAMEYLKQTSPAAFDVAKYKLEIGIIKSKSELIDTVLVKELKSSNKTLAEHCAKLIKERKTYMALPTLLELIEHEDNPYVVRSSLDALVGMSPLKVLLNARSILDNRKNFVEKYSFLNKHLSDLDEQITVLQKVPNN